ncbi:O-antigen ligase family protein [Salinibacterium sp. TMP30]|uniref:O-antigen ligase family protein n=1 Tax=Salinibacterium sp. TMP30 TaxID=3138237 RepID=UPI003138EA5A
MSSRELHGTRAISRSIIGTWFLVVLSVVSWRPDALFTGGFDSVVVAKALLALIALGCALLIYQRSTTRARVGVRSTILLVIVVGLSCLGALASGDVMPSLVLAVRILLLAATVYVLASCAAPMQVLTALLIAMGILTIIGAVTGIPGFLADGRLATGIPAMKPNELAGLAAPPLLGLAITIARSGLTASRAALLLAFASILLATGSRTTLLVVVIAMVVGILLAWPVPHSTGIALILLAPVSYAVVAFTNVVSEVAIRGQDVDQLATLSSRTIAWDAVFSIPMATWHKWIGAGLAVKTVEVDQRWWDVQVLDSSWISLLSQTGIVGLVAVSVWVVFTLRDSLVSRELRALTFPLLVLLLLRSALENGLIESSVIFTLFFLTSLVVERGYQFPFEHQKTVRYSLASTRPTPPTLIRTE